MSTSSRADVERFVQIQQAAVRIDNDGLAVLAKFAAVAILGGGSDGNPRKHADARWHWFAIRSWLPCIVHPADRESTVHAWKVSKNAVRKKLAEIA